MRKCVICHRPFDSEVGLHYHLSKAHDNVTACVGKVNGESIFVDLGIFDMTEQNGDDEL